jgi:hypothetical protein
VAARGTTIAAAKPAAGTHSSNALSYPAGSPQESRSCPEPLPVWLAALMASRCYVSGNALPHEVRWQPVAGRAIYTNFDRCTETIEPLGVRLAAGETLAVYWIPGETAYTLEICSNTEKCA